MLFSLNIVLCFLYIILQLRFLFANFTSDPLKRDYKTLNELALDLEKSEESRIKESPICDEEDLRNGIQCFSVLPNQSYEVEVNQSILLPCVVTNQHGKVQWRAISVLLGYDRLVPGRPRHKIVGDPTKGEHNLSIRNITVADSGKYECQVQPVGVSHPPLRRITFIEVLELPDSPKISSNFTYLDNNILEISIKDQFKYIDLSCQSKGGRPKIEFKWFVNDGQMCSMHRSCDISIISLSHSKLRFLPMDITRVKNITCVVINKATETHPDFINFQTLKVIIQTPPSRPVIQTGDINLEIIEYDQLKVRCICSPPGWPSASLSWEWKLLRNSFNQSQLTIDKSSFVVTHSQSTVTSTLHLFNISRQFHSAYIHCVANHPTGSIESAGVKVLVKYYPENLEISGVNRNSAYKSVILLLDDSPQKMRCTTSLYYYSIKIHWSVENIDQSFVRSMTSIDKVWEIEENIRRESIVTVSFDPVADDITLTCAAISMGEVILTKKVKLLRIKMPQIIYVQNYKESYLFKENEIIHFECISRGGMPPSTLSWLINDEIIEDEMTSSRANDTFQVLALSMPMKRYHNKAIIRCQFKSRFAQLSSMSTKDMKVTVVFPPSKIDIDRSPGSVATEQITVDYHCSSDESNPPTILTWRIQFCDKSQNCTKTDLSGELENIFPGMKYQGYLKRSTLKLTLNWKMHESVLFCLSSYSYNNQILSSLEASVPLVVLYTPKFLNFQNGSQLFMKLGVQNQSIHVQISANPPLTQLSWSFNNRSILVQEINSKLYFPVVHLAHMQEYVLIAKNQAGVSSLKIFINVTYGPKIVGESVVLYRTTSHNAELECLFESNPPPQFSFVKWKIDKKQFEFSDAFGDENQNSLHCNQGYWQSKKLKLFVKCRMKGKLTISSSLIIYDASPGDVCFYRCTVSDNYGQMQVKTMGLVLLTIPRFISIPLFAKIALITNSNSKSSCLLYSEPLPSVSITLIEHQTNTSISVTPSVTRISAGLYIATATFQSRRISNQSQIFWKASNNMGLSYLSIPLVSESAPDPPVLVNIHYFGSTSIFLEWTQSFDGGYFQTHEIYWRITNYNDSNHNMVEIPGNYSRKNMAFTITDLSANRDYEVTLCSINRMHGRSRGCPKRILKNIQKQPVHTSTNQRREDLDNIFTVNLKIVIAVAAFVFGLVLLTASIIILMFKRKRSSLSNVIARDNTDDSSKIIGDILIPNLTTIDAKLVECYEMTASDNLVIPSYTEGAYYTRSNL